MSSRTPNRLIHETSPYLQQHAHNPVDWHAWGDEAIAAAREQDKPIFLSIGYSACHWCHVMEHESFENPELAALMNEVCVNIKVDREERPDLDQIYMNSVVAMSGHGGWPMSVFLLPDLRPFFGGTYWPPESRYGRSGFRDVLKAVQDAWTNRREMIEANAGQLTDAVVSMSLPAEKRSPLNAEIVESATRKLCRACDRTHGGFGGAPKFPHPMDLRVLLRGWKRFQHRDALDVVTLTLDKMGAGGIYDHLGGGFARYSTDERWLVPHFEKMLYDNALLTSAYVEAFQATGAADYARIVRQTLDYVLREMTHPDGGYYSTQDADSEGVEGKFFVWTLDEIRQHLSSDDARVFAYCYDVTAEGSWHDPHGHGPAGPNNILNRVKTHSEAARVLNLSEEELRGVLNRCRSTLFDVRSRRVPPGRDEKILASWNGLMIAAMAQAAVALDEPRYAAAARRAADFALSKMREPDGRLLHAWKDGRARFNGYLDDYACLIDGLIDVYQATFDASYVTAAVALAERMVAQFRDADGGGFFYTSSDHESLIARQKDVQDNATPSGNGMAACALLRLARLISRDDFEREGVATLEMLSGHLAEHPLAGGQSLIALDFFLGPTREIVIADSGDGKETGKMLRAVFQRFDPNKVAALKHPGDSDSSGSPLAALFEGKTAVDGRTAAYVCERGACGLAVTDPSALK